MLWKLKRKESSKDRVERLRDKARATFRQAGYDRLFQPTIATELPPNFLDLALLRDAVLEAKPSLILEYGSGYSTYVFAKTLQSLGQGRVISIELGEEWQKISESHLAPDLVERVSFIKPQPTIRLASLRMPGDAPDLWFQKRSKAPRRTGIATVSFPEVHDLTPDFIFIDGPDSRQIPGYTDSVTQDLLPAIVSDPFVHLGKSKPIICVDGRREQCAILSANLPPNYRTVIHEEQRFTFFYPPAAA